MFKTIKDSLPWYLRPDYLTEIVSEMIKGNSTTTATTKNNFKMGLEEVVYGIGVLVFLWVVRFYM